MVVRASRKPGLLLQKPERALDHRRLDTQDPLMVKGQSSVLRLGSTHARVPTLPLNRASIGLLPMPFLYFEQLMRVPMSLDRCVRGSPLFLRRRSKRSERNSFLLSRLRCNLTLSLMLLYLDRLRFWL